MAFYIVLALIIVSLAVIMIFSVLSALHSGQPRRAPALSRYPKVSILKPVKFMDDGMEKNIESFYNLDYPDYEIIFCFDGFNEEIHQLIVKFKEQHPDVPTKIVQAGFKKLMNPKIEMLEVMVPEASGELYWVSDSNIRVETETLKMLVLEYLEKGSKIVFSPVKGTGSRSIGSIIENSYLNFFVSGSIISAWVVVKRQVIVGKSMLVEKAALDKTGGFANFREYLAEDYIMGDTYVRNNVPVSTNFTWAINFNSHSTVRSFMARMTRWAKLRFHIDRLFYILEILVNPIAISLFSALVIGARAYPLILVSVVCKIIFEYVNLFAVNRSDARKLWIILVYPFCVLVKDMLMLFIYVVPFFSNTVNWRGWKIRIGNKSRIIAENI